VLLRQQTKKAEAILVRANIKFDPAMHDEGYVSSPTETSHTTLPPLAREFITARKPSSN